MNKRQECPFILKAGIKFKTFLKNKLLVKTSFVEDDLNINTMGKCIIIKLGEHVVFCCNFPSIMENPMVELKQFHNDYMLLMSSKSGGCCSVNLSTKTLNNWSDAEEILIEDLLEAGHDQLVVCFPGNDFVITDFACCTLDTRAQAKENLNDKYFKPPCTMHPSVKSSLEHKILDSQQEKQRLEANIREKQIVIQESWQSLLNMTLDLQHSQSKTTSLVRLFDGEIEELQTSCSIEQVNFKILDTWIRKVAQMLVIGCSIENKSRDDMNFSNFSLSITILNSGVTSCHSSTRTNDHQNKWQHGGAETFLVALDLPHLVHTDILTFCFNLHLSFSSNPEKLYVVSLGKHDLNRLNIMAMGSIEREEYSKRNTIDNLAFQLVCQKQHFVLISKVSSLELLGNVLAQRLNCVQLSVGTVNILSLTNYQGEIRLQMGKNYIEGTVLAVSIDFLNSLIIEIQHVLPADVSFQPLLKTESFANACNCLLKESKAYHTYAKTKQNEKNVIVLDSEGDGNDQQQDTVHSKVLQSDISIVEMFHR